MKEFIKTDICNDCIFLVLCEGCQLEHCNGECYVSNEVEEI